MEVRFSKTYIERLFHSGDVHELCSIIDTISKLRALPERLWLAQRLYAWCCWSEYGISQYYEALSQEDYINILEALTRYGLDELADRYRSGMEIETGTSDKLHRDLNNWLEDHDNEITAICLDLISGDIHSLGSECGNI
ncbi:hypothetical protein Plim_3374 [Planctopirus limnophila DSM 3776]|uniref:DUF4375 domain-containing protein n=1 Tax=Planctopirus limnophila (strain ATCC 43296 / DSM 3776 / IFAM 1008 / Mu 290) TaxID=521674 RepID=D5SUD4_PLAL2|nr:hypothetical protein [Planctopirus limnophila]ADG69187.1 hypothetical protein Plim_3374 [Planctopirus limnophila DSM 3776]